MISPIIPIVLDTPEKALAKYCAYFCTPDNVQDTFHSVQKLKSYATKESLTLDFDAWYYQKTENRIGQPKRVAVVNGVSALFTKVEEGYRVLIVLGSDTKFQKTIPVKSVRYQTLLKDIIV